MPHIDAIRFGEITVAGKRFKQVMIVGETVTEREYQRLVERFGTSHKIGDWEIKELFKGAPAIIVVGTGQEGMLEVGKDLLKRSKNRNIRVIAALTGEAVEIYNEKIREGRAVNALIHTTC